MVGMGGRGIFLKNLRWWMGCYVFIFALNLYSQMGQYFRKGGHYIFNWLSIIS